MGLLSELKLHIEALHTAVESDAKFFASIIHYVRRLKEILTSSKKELTKEELKILAAKIEEFYKQWRPTGAGLYIPPRQTSDTDATVKNINSIVDTIIKLPDNEFKKIVPSEKQEKSIKKDISDRISPCVFIGHGRSKLWIKVKTYLEDELNLPTVAYESEPRVGESIIPILEKMLNQATFAVLVLTAEDVLPQGSKRARQNVIHEAGLFQGRLGFKKAVLLIQEGVEEFTNIDGLQYIPFSEERFEQVFYELQRALKREKQIV